MIMYQEVEDDTVQEGIDLNGRYAIAVSLVRESYIDIMLFGTSICLIAIILWYHINHINHINQYHKRPLFEDEGLLRSIHDIDTCPLTFQKTSMFFSLINCNISGQTQLH